MTETSGPIAAASPASTTPAASLHDGGRIRSVVGPNAHIFMRRWVRMLERAGCAHWQVVWRPSLNWPALLLGSMWFFYRKLYVAGAACVLIMLALGLAGPFLGLPSGIGLLPQVGFALFANAIYLRRALQIANRHDNDADRASAGGVSWPGAIFWTLGACAAFALTALAAASLRSGGGGSPMELARRCADSRMLEAVQATYLKQRGGAVALKPVRAHLRITPAGEARCEMTFRDGAGASITLRYVLPPPGQEFSVKLLD
ncbi:DUF2628 domain-containing protein [Camelimonas sp. ID_303_24]